MREPFTSLATSSDTDFLYLVILLFRLTNLLGIVYPSLLASFHPELVIENSCHVSFSFLFPLFSRGYYISSLFFLFGNGMAITLSERQSHMLSPSSIRRLFDNFFPFFSTFRLPYFLIHSYSYFCIYLTQTNK
jgi:hypothetical protein